MTKERRFHVHGKQPDRYAKLRFVYKMPAHGADTSGLSFKLSLVSIAVKTHCLATGMEYAMRQPFVMDESSQLKPLP